MALRTSSDPWKHVHQVSSTSSRLLHVLGCCPCCRCCCPTSCPCHTQPCSTRGPTPPIPCATGALLLPRLPAACRCTCLLQPGARPAAAHAVREAGGVQGRPGLPIHKVDSKQHGHTYPHVLLLSAAIACLFDDRLCPSHCALLPLHARSFPVPAARSTTCARSQSAPTALRRSRRLKS